MNDTTPSTTRPTRRMRLIKEAICLDCKKTVPVFRTSDKQVWFSSHRTDEKDDLGRQYQCEGSYKAVQS